MGLIDVDWRRGIIKRQPSVKSYVDKLSKGELWLRNVDDLRRIGSLIQTKYKRINKEYEKLV
jgi:hypothetical protein